MSQELKERFEEVGTGLGKNMKVVAVEYGKWRTLLWISGIFGCATAVTAGATGGRPLKFHYAVQTPSLRVPVEWYVRCHVDQVVSQAVAVDGGTVRVYASQSFLFLHVFAQYLAHQVPRDDGELHFNGVVG